MPSNPDSQFAFRSVEMAEFYDANFKMAETSIGSRSQAAKRDLERYRFVLEDELKRVVLAKEEAIALYSAFNGCNTSHIEELPILRNGVISEVKETHPHLKNLPGIIMALSPAQWVAVVDACNRVGAGSHRIENLGSELKRVGLCNK